MSVCEECGWSSEHPIEVGPNHYRHCRWFRSPPQTRTLRPVHRGPGNYTELKAGEAWAGCDHKGTVWVARATVPGG